MDMTTVSSAVLAATAAGGVAYAVLAPRLSGEARGDKRRNALVAVDEPGTRKGARTPSRREIVAQSLKEMEDREKARDKLTLEMRIAQAGLRWNRKRFIITSVAVGLGACLMALILSGKPLVALGLGVVGGLGLPRWLLSFLRKRRIKGFTNEFPNAVDIVVRGVKAGLPLGDCLRIIANEAAEPVKSEFKFILEQQTLGLTVSEACAKLYTRVPVSEANFFGIVVAVQSKTGGSLADAFGNLSKVLRERKKMKGKIDAMSTEAKASAMIIGALPVVVAGMLALTTPAYIAVLFTTDAGKIALLGSAVWMTMGVLVMRKMINFDF